MTWPDPLPEREKHRHAGSLDQLNRVRRLTLCDGPGAGMHLIDVETEAGLRATFCQDRALDLLDLRYRGINIGYRSKNALTHEPVRPDSGHFAATWPGGMLFTGGLRNAGPACEHEGIYHPTHGQISNQAADGVSCSLDQAQGVIQISGDMHESALGGHHLRLRRHIRVSLEDAVVRWEDQVTNLSMQPTPVFLLYHVNFGYPFLGPQLDLQLPAGTVIPKDAFAECGLNAHDQITSPQDGLPEQVYIHLPLPGQDPQTRVRLIRKDLGLAASLSWSRKELPFLVQWKAMAAGDYALGLEPSTSRLRGCAVELQEGYDQVIKPFETWTYHLELALETLSQRRSTP